MIRQSRSLRLLLCIAGATWLPGCGASQPAAQVEQAAGPADLDAAASARAFAHMPDLADQAIALQARRHAAPPEAVARQLRASAHKAFDPALLAAQLPPAGAPDAAADRALANYQAAAARLAATLSTAGEATVRQDAEAAQARLSARADRDAIDALAAVMPAPERAGERAVTLRRMLAALGAVNGGLPDELRTADAAKLEEGVSEMMANSRRPGVDHADGLLTLGTQIEVARGATKRALLELSPADVAALRAHYGSPTGRARRQLLVASLVVADDQGGRAMLLDFFSALRRLPPEAFH